MSDYQKQLIVVVGMHRSGTSMVTRGLRVFGVELPSNLLPPDKWNSKGYWEDREIYFLNEDILSALGHKWDTIKPIDSVTLSKKELQDYRLRAVALLRDRLSETDCLGLKDPRFCVLLPFWKEVFDIVGAEARYVIPVRNPISVVRSLQKRNKHQASESYYLWLVHVLGAVRHTRGAKRVVVDYDQFLTDVEEQLRRIADALELKLDRDSDEFRSFCSEFVDPKLRHTRFAPTDLALDRDCPPQVVDLYEVLQAAANDELDLDSGEAQRQIENLWEQVESTAPAFALIHDLDMRLDSAMAYIDQLKEEIRWLSQETARQQAKIEDYEKVIEAKESEISDLRQIASDSQNLVGELRTVLEQREKDLRALEIHANADAKKRAEAESELARVLRSKSWRMTKPLRFAGRVARGDWNAVKEGIKNYLSDSVFPAHLRAGPRRLRSRERKERKSGIREEGKPHDGGKPTTSKIHFTPLEPDGIQQADISAKLIAFYLPQFHRIPENDAWWGRGFTEWTNVGQAEPKYEGHYQPRVPGELGYYDLRNPDVQRRQVELAKRYGIHGFCFYFYWFAGRRLLERPLENFMRDPAISFPFCICWANEHWTRRWDGDEHEILMSAAQSPDDDAQVIVDVAEIMSHENYIRIDGRPLFVVYRPQLLSDPNETVARWRRHCISTGVGDPYLVAVQYKEPVDPRPLGFDAALEFPPNTPVPLRLVNDTVGVTSENFQGFVYDFDDLMEGMTYRELPPFPLIRCVAPGWDNTARRRAKNNATIFAGSNPAKYEEWLKRAIRLSTSIAGSDDKFVFINGWNEWGESAYLEPDVRYGYSFLKATSNALREVAREEREIPNRLTALFVSHSAQLGGAQMGLLGLLGWLKDHTAVKIRTLLLGDGPLTEEFEKVGGTLKYWKIPGDSLQSKVAFIEAYCGQKPDVVVVNSLASAKEVDLIKALGAPVISYVHELSYSIERYAGADRARQLVEISDRLVTPSEAVKSHLESEYRVEGDKCIVLGEPLLPAKTGLSGAGRKESKEELRARLGLVQDEIVVLGCGLDAAYRKGADLFIETAKYLRQRIAGGWHFYWVGDLAPSERMNGKNWHRYRRESLSDDVGKYVTFLGTRPNTSEYFEAADIFLLTSREDPFPLAMLEAARSGLPMVCFAESGGAPEFASEGAGVVVPHSDAKSMANAVADLIEDPGLRASIGEKAREKAEENYDVDRATAPRFLEFLRNSMGRAPSVSVIVPNYNHEPFLVQRLESILSQKFRDFELILLDDGSTDRSIEILETYSRYPGARLLRNETNSGSPFPQWMRGLAESKCDLVWIAESDDFADEDFLDRLLPLFSDPEVVLAYSASRAVDVNNVVLGSYKDSDYLKQWGDKRWNHCFTVDGNEEVVRHGLGIVNTILTASAVVFRKPCLDQKVTNSLSGMKFMGDWLFFLELARNGKIAYIPDELNSHRRHERSAIGTVLQARDSTAQMRFFEELETVYRFVIENFQLDEQFLRDWTKGVQTLAVSVLGPETSLEELEEHFPYSSIKKAIEEKAARTATSA